MSDELNAAIAHVAAKHCLRIAKPGRWVVWRVEGQAKPRLKIFPTPQGDALCRCS